MGGCGEGGVGETDQQKDTSQWAIDRRTDKQTDKTVSPAQKQADRLTEGINVYLIVHCSVVVSPLHPAKWLLINQPDLLLFHSADRLLVSGRWRVVIDPAWMTKDHQELLKHNSSLLLPLLLPVYLSLALSVTASLSLLLPVLMNFIEWSRRVQAESICALLDCKNPLLFLLMSEFSSSAIFAAAFLCLPPLIVFRFNSVGELKMVWFCKQTWPQTNLSEE